MKLYEIDSAIQAVYDQIEQNEGVLPDELETALNDLQLERTTKISNIIKLMRNIDADITAIDVEISQLEKKLTAAKNRKQSVKNHLAYRDWETDRKSTRLNSSHSAKSRMPSSA